MFPIDMQCAHCQTVFRGTVPSAKKCLMCPTCGKSVRLSPSAEATQLQVQGDGSAAISVLADDDQPAVLVDDAPAEVPSQTLVSATVNFRMGTTIAAASHSAATDEEGSPSSSIGLSLSDFQIRRRLGAGGMGTVFLAQQMSQNRLVALKVLAEVLTRRQSFVARFHREGQVLASLDHPGIIRFYGAGESDGMPFFAMEYVDGCNVAFLQEQLGRFQVGDAVFLVLRWAEALGFAHERNITHRDIKPSNLMITRLGQVKLTDMGLAKSLREDLGLTDTETAVGTPRYMAPEQARNARHADHRSDIYALGGVLYHLLTGQTPFSGSTRMELLLAKEQGMFRSARLLNPEVPARLDLLVDKMLAKDPRHRYQSCGQLVRDLERLDIANERLSLNPLRLRNAARARGDYETVEILMIHDDVKDILLVEQALADCDLPSNLSVVSGGAEALDMLARDNALLPSLIILGRDVHAPGSLEVLRAINDSPRLNSIPLIVFAATTDTVAFLKKQGLETRLIVSRPEDLSQFEQLVQSVHGLCMTVAEKR